jgi:glycosyltransferase involved in cell wall biosynthesis
MTTSKPSVSVVYPMFNEEENIERAVDFAETVLTDMASDYEILIVNDASTDRSAEIAEALVRSRPCVKVFHHERNLKLGGALRTGFSKATKELVFYCDSDLPVDLTELNRAARIMEFTSFRPFGSIAPRKDLSARYIPSFTICLSVSFFRCA